MTEKIRESQNKDKLNQQTKEIPPGALKALGFICSTTAKINKVKQDC